MNLKSINILKLLDLIYFLFIISIGLFFWKERALFADCSPALYEFIDKHIPFFGLNSYSTSINYILPCFLSLFSIPIKVIVFSFALNYLVLPIIVFVFLRYKQSSIKYELLFLVSFAFFNTFTFYYSLHDYWTGFYLFFILIRLVDDYTFAEKRNTTFFIIILNALILNAHSSLLFPLFSFYIFLYSFNSFKNKKLLYYATTVVLIYFIQSILFSMSYDKNILSTENNLFTIINSSLFISFIHTIKNINLFYFSSIAFVLFILLKNREFKIVLIYILFIFISLFLFLYYFQNFKYTIYSEGQLKSVSTIIPIMIVFVLFKYCKKSTIVLFCFLCYLFSCYNLLQGSKIVTKQYNVTKQLLTQFNSNVYLYSNENHCPLECISLSKYSFFVNQIEYNKKYCIFSNYQENIFVKTVLNNWIDYNKTQKNPILKFSDTIEYIDADSANIAINAMFAIYPNDECNTMINRLSQ